MSPRTPDIDEVFFAALEQTNPEARAAYLDEVCVSDADLRHRVERLLDAQLKVRGFLESPAAGQTVSLGTDPAPELTGTIIGPYTLLEQIGEGGMGVEYLAEQIHPIRRKVALKIIKPGMDTRQVIARFEVERQALALMDHANIARVVDAGATDTGRLYFVMELVKGVPITTYCDTVRLPAKERLELFVPVCQAIQHAHQKGIIHRDIKPSNVLITMIDGEPVAEVIDFGVAKAIDLRLVEQSVFTQHGALIGTLEYMSPEQAELSGFDIDTRSDIYSLGVLMYELLTGTTPVDREKLRQAAYAEVLRQIKEEDPPKPSTRLSDSGDHLASLAALRRTEPARLTKQVRGELDWIVMKALDKDRTRRYETANGFARDIERYLADEPVEAGPPSASYKLRKFARKHRAALTTVLAFAALLLIAATVGTYLAIRATNAERLASRRLSDVQQANAATTAALADTRKAQAATQEALKQSEDARKEAETVSTFLVKAFRSPDPSRDGYQVKVIDVLDRAMEELGKEFTGSPITKGDLLDALGQTYQNLGQIEKAISAYKKALAQRDAARGTDHPDTVLSLKHLIDAYIRSIRHADAIPLLERVITYDAAQKGSDHPETIGFCLSLTICYRETGRVADAVALIESTLKRSEAKLGTHHEITQAAYVNVAQAYSMDNSHSSVDRAARWATFLKHCETTLGPEHLFTQSIRRKLSPPSATAKVPELTVAERETVFRDNDARLGPDHVNTKRSFQELASAYQSAGRLGDAVKLYEQALKRSEMKNGPDHADPDIMQKLQNAYIAGSRFDDAIALSKANLKSCEARLGPSHIDTILGRDRLSQVYYSSGRAEDAIALSASNVKLCEARLGPDHAVFIKTRETLLYLYSGTGRHAEKIPVLRQKLADNEAKRGPDNIITLRIRTELARSYLFVDRVADAVGELEATLKLSEVQDAVFSFSVRNDLAIAYFAADRAEDAIALHESVFRHKLQKFGSDHVETLAAEASLGHFHHIAAGQYHESEFPGTKKPHLPDDKILITRHLSEGVRLMEDVLKRANRQRKSMYGVEDARFCLSGFYEKFGQFASAERVFRDRLEWALTLPAGQETQVLVSKTMLGDCLVRQERWSDAEPYLRASLSHQEKTVPGDWNTFNTRSTLGAALLDQAKFAEAEPLVISGYEGMKAREARIPTPDKARLREAALRVIRLYKAWGKPDQAKAWMEKLGLADLPDNVFNPP